MGAIFTSKGDMDEADLWFSTGEIDNDHEHTTWEEWRDETGEVVKRNVHVRLKQGVEMTMELGAMG